VNALILLVIISGTITILIGLLKFGSLVRFVSYSVMIGFLTGISILTILSQMPAFVGVTVTGSNKIMQTMKI